MSKTYVAVQRTGQKENELTHWKYIKRVKKNGKWRYYYNKDSLKKDIQARLTKPKEAIIDGKQMILDDNKVYVKDTPTRDGYGTYYHKNRNGAISELHVTKGDKLFNSESTLTFLHSKKSVTIREIGKLEQSIDAAKEWLNNKLFGTKL